jgi:hypothetical protein
MVKLVMRSTVNTLYVGSNPINLLAPPPSLEEASAKKRGVEIKHEKKKWCPLLIIKRKEG